MPDIWLLRESVLKITAIKVTFCSHFPYGIASWGCLKKHFPALKIKSRNHILFSLLIVWSLFSFPGFKWAKHSFLVSPPFAAGNKKQNKTEHLVRVQMKLMVSLMFSVLNFIYLFIFGCAGSLLLHGLIAS